MANVPLETQSFQNWIPYQKSFPFKWVQVCRWILVSRISPPLLFSKMPSWYMKGYFTLWPAGETFLWISPSPSCISPGTDMLPTVVTMKMIKTHGVLPFGVGEGVKGHCHLRSVCWHSPWRCMFPATCFHLQSPAPAASSLWPQASYKSIGCLSLSSSPHQVDGPCWIPCKSPLDHGSQEHGLLAFQSILLLPGLFFTTPPQPWWRSETWISSLFSLSQVHTCTRTHTHTKSLNKAHLPAQEPNALLPHVYLGTNDKDPRGWEEQRCLSLLFSSAHPHSSYHSYLAQRGRSFLLFSMSSP